MKVAPFDIMDLVHGALHTAVTAEGEVRFARFTEAQKEAYYARREDFGVKCNASAGVTLDFISNTDHISFEAEFRKGSSRTYATVDLLVDNVLFDSKKVASPGVYPFAFDLPQGEHRITLALPWSAETELRALTVDDGATLIPLEKELRILSIGDSITQGYVAEHPSMTYVSYFARALNAEVLNQGIGGYQFFKESLNGAPDWQPDVITLAYGTNDFHTLHSHEAFAAQAKEYITALCAAYPDTPILAITPIYRGDKPLEERLPVKDYSFAEAMEILREIYAAHPQIRVLDGLAFYPRPQDFFAPDYLHPNDQGFLLYGRAVEQAIKEVYYGFH